MSTNIVLESFMGRNSCSGHWINIATSEAGTINPSTRVLVGFVLLWSLVLCVCFVDRCLSFCTFFFGHRVVCPSIYEFWSSNFSCADLQIWKALNHISSTNQNSIYMLCGNNIHCLVMFTVSLITWRWALNMETTISKYWYCYSVLKQIFHYTIDDCGLKRVTCACNQ